MGPAEVDMSKLQRDGKEYVVKLTVEKIPYVLRFYPGALNSAKKAGAENSWIFQFRVDVQPGLSDALRKDTQSKLNESFKKQNFNNGMWYKVMPVVKGYLKGFIAEMNPDAFAFSADVTEPSRVSLFRAVVKRSARELDEMGYYMLSEEEAEVDARADLVPFIFVRS